MAKKVNIKELARRYTTAVFELAKSTNNLDKVAADLDKLTGSLNDDAGLQKLLASKLLSENQQLEAVRSLGKSQGYDALTVNFLLIVAKNGRLEFLPEIVKAFREKIAEEKGEVTAIITTAEALSKTQVEAISKDLSQKTGKTVKVEEIVKPEIIGGLIVKVGSKMFDYSIKSRLNRLKNKLSEAS